jgi:hypothetical protein
MEQSTHSSPRECKYHGVTRGKWDESQSNYREVACCPVGEKKVVMMPEGTVIVEERKENHLNF